MNNTATYPQSLPHGYRLQGKENEYIIDHTLGQGAFGITYLAKYKTRVNAQMGMGTIWAEVAIKEFFMRELSSREEETKILRDTTENSIVNRYRRAFLREAKNLSQIRHPNIVNVFEVIETNNTAYIVMEFINGDNLDNYIINNKRIAEEKALHLFEPLCNAMVFMHAQRMLHLDIKPKNVMLDEEERPFLIDFGLSKQYTSDGEPESSTSIGLGTPGYAPIEQAEQRDDDNSFRATIDVYALGGTLYKILKGETPPKASEISESFLDGVNMIKEELSAIGVSERVASSVAKAMHPSSRRRYQSVMDFSTDLGFKIEIKGEFNETETPTSTETIDDMAGKNIATDKQERPLNAELSQKSEETLIVSPTIAMPTLKVSAALYPESHDYVDLGLSVLWATCNIGAKKAEDFGDFFAWGETKNKDTYCLENYSFRIQGDSWKNVKLSKYHFQPGSLGNMADENDLLDKEDDAAYVNWGSNWHIPRDKEWQELMDNCTWDFSKQANVWGYRIISKINGNSIFLPATGSRDDWNQKNNNNTDDSDRNSCWDESYYWSSSLKNLTYWYGRCIRFNSYGVRIYFDHRYFGHSIRAVFRRENER